MSCIEVLHTIHHLASVDSTMRVAAELARGGEESGTVVWADEQTAGQGRQGRSWQSDPGTGLYISEILRLGVPPDSLPAVTLAVGLAAADAIQTFTALACDLRWPNDVLVAGLKCAGILLQLEEDAIIAGIGINLNHEKFPPELEGTATSLRMITGKIHDREALLQLLLRSIDVHTEILVRDGKEAILRMFTHASSYVSGRQVVVDQGTTQLRGITAGLDPSGFLVLQQNTGQRTVIYAGGVRPAS